MRRLVLVLLISACPEAGPRIGEPCQVRAVDAVACVCARQVCNPGDLGEWRHVEFAEVCR